MLRKLALASLASFILLTPALVTAQTANFRVEEATIEDIQGAIMRGELTSTRLVQLLSQPHQGVQRHLRQSAGWGARSRADHADQERASTQRVDDFELASRDQRKARVRPT